MIHRVAVVACMLVACTYEAERRPVDPEIPAPSLRAGKWKADASDVGDLPPYERQLLVGIRPAGDGTEVALVLGNGIGAVVPGRLEGDAVVVEAVSLLDKPSTAACNWTRWDLDRLALRVDGDRLEVEAVGVWEKFEGDFFHGGDLQGPLTGERVEALPALIDLDDATWLSPLGRLVALVDEPVRLPAEARIEADGRQIAGHVEDAGHFATNVRVVPAAALPWGDTVEVEVEVEDAAGHARTLRWSTPTVAAPTTAPAPLLTSFDGYAAAGLEPLAPSVASELFGREGGALGFAWNPWVLAFEAVVPETEAPVLQIDLLHVGYDEGNGLARQEVVVTIASDAARFEHTLAPSGAREAPTSSRWDVVEAPALLPVDLGPLRGERIAVSVSGRARGGACAQWGPTPTDVVLERVELVP
ncbi:hypothetical protein [Vulgatibacter sp.]|uniref:hypothetical protein n=1 Tax=Vulgatibacter sp. TaxID=1971226 RepID=UPI003561D75E